MIEKYSKLKQSLNNLSDEIISEIESYAIEKDIAYVKLRESVPTKTSDCKYAVNGLFFFGGVPTVTYKYNMNDNFMTVAEMNNSENREALLDEFFNAHEHSFPVADLLVDEQLEILAKLVDATKLFSKNK